MEFKLTPEAHKHIIASLSDKGLLDIELHRSGKNTLKVYAVHNGNRVMELPSVELKVGSTLMLEGMRVEIAVSR